MRLNETLKNCLLALASRYPKSLVDVNQDMPGQHSLLVEAWPPPCSPIVMIELLQAHAPETLASPACLVIDGQNHAIYLLEQWQERPAFWIHDRIGSVMPRKVVNDVKCEQVLTCSVVDQAVLHSLLIKCVM
jgi:hypothetical protein